MHPLNQCLLLSIVAEIKKGLCKENIAIVDYILDFIIIYMNLNENQEHHYSPLVY